MNPKTGKKTPQPPRNTTVRAASDRARRTPPPSRPRASRKPSETGSSEGVGPGAELPDDSAPSIGENLRRLRSERNLSLDGLAQLSGVSRAMLGQIELNRSVPTITVLWRIARALDVPFSSLMQEPTEKGPSVMRRTAARFLTSADGSFKSRALFPSDSQRYVEFYEVRLTPGATEEASAHAAGTLENLVVAKGILRVEASDESTELATGDAMVFRADVPHVYHNPGASEAVLYMVITYAKRT